MHHDAENSVHCVCVCVCVRTEAGQIQSTLQVYNVTVIYIPYDDCSKDETRLSNKSRLFGEQIDIYSALKSLVYFMRRFGFGDNYGYRIFNVM